MKENYKLNAEELLKKFRTLDSETDNLVTSLEFQKHRLLSQTKYAPSMIKAINVSIDYMDKRINDNIDKLINIRQYFLEKVELIPDPNSRELLRNYTLCGMTWEQAADKMYTSLRQVYNWRAKALGYLQAVMDGRMGGVLPPDFEAWETRKVTHQQLKVWVRCPRVYPNKLAWSYDINSKQFWAVAPHEKLGITYSVFSTDLECIKWLREESKKVREWEKFTNQKQWEEYLKSLLKRNDKALKRAVSLIYENQTWEEQNSGQVKDTNHRGFSKIDSEFLTQIAIKVRNGLELTPRELSITRNKMPKYWRQLMIISKNNMNSTKTY